MENNQNGRQQNWKMTKWNITTMKDDNHTKKGRGIPIEKKKITNNNVILIQQNKLLI